MIGPLSIARKRLRAHARMQLVTADEARERVSDAVRADALRLAIPSVAARTSYTQLAARADAARRTRARAQADTDARYHAKHPERSPKRQTADARERAEQARLDDLVVWARYLAKRDRRGRLAPPTRIAEPAPARSERIGQWPTTPTP